MEDPPDLTNIDTVYTETTGDILVNRFLESTDQEGYRKDESIGADGDGRRNGMSVKHEIYLWGMADLGSHERLAELLVASFPSIDEAKCSRLSHLVVAGDEDSLHGAVLMAVDANVPQLVSLLLRRVNSKGWKETGRSSKFRLKNISPLMLACQNNYFAVVAVLLSRDHKLPAPHNIKCVCDECDVWRKRDALHRQKYILNVCRAICSPAFFWLACPDPLAAASKMAYEMERQANDNPEFHMSLKKCCEDCREFCGHIARMLMTSTEIDIAIRLMEPMQLVNISKYPGLDLAISCHIKDFVTDPLVNNHLKAIWYGSNNQKDWTTFVVHVAYPITAPLYMFSAGKLFPTYRTPYYRFVSYTTSHVMFLAVLIALMASVDRNTAGWSQKGWQLACQWYVWTYVAGLIVSDIETVNSSTLSKFIEAWWHWLDFFALGIYLVSFYVWVMSQLRSYDLTDVTRAHWYWNQPTLVYEVTFSLATAMSFWRLFYYFQLSKMCGTLIISIGRCIRPILGHMLVIFLETMAFSVAINNIYKNYVGNYAIEEDGTINKNPDYFTSVPWTARWMYWTFYGYLAPGEMRVVVGNAGTRGRVTHHIVTAATGELLIALYYAVTIVILLNLLVAMMTGEAKQIAANEDIEWKWERAYIWHEFMQKHFTMPAPFNIIHIFFMKIATRCKGEKTKPPAYSNTEYQSLMSALMLRYMDAQ